MFIIHPEIWKKYVEMFYNNIDPILGIKIPPKPSNRVIRFKRYASIDPLLKKDKVIRK